ncbi:MAG: FAD-binding protein [Firmicutes bacterium]|nr:FAD-binding protein [Bacillota bacterium]
MNEYSCDVLVVGGGGGALRAAIALAEEHPELKVLLATKGQLGKSGVTAVACSDRMAFHATLPHTPPGGEDAWRYHAEDIYRIGGCVSDPELAAILAKNSGDAFQYLDALGVPFVKEGTVPRQFVTDGSEYPRACYTGPRTAVHIEEALVRRFHALNIPVLEQCMVTRLLTDTAGINGALALLGGRVVPISAGAVILATGGAGLIYQQHVFPPGMTGDGYAMALRAGAELVNMEFIQMGVASVKTRLNCSGSLFRALPRLVDDSGREFLSEYTGEMTVGDRLSLLFRKGASWPVSNEHDTKLIDIAVYREQMAGRRVFLDFGANPAGYDFEALPASDRKRYQDEMVVDLGSARDQTPLARLQEINPDSIAWLREHGVDLEAGDAMEIALCGQHFQGGIKIDNQGQTIVPGLYAVGETAGGQHGANRPGGNALLDSQVFGFLAARSAAERAREHKQTSVSAAAIKDAQHQLAAAGGYKPQEFRERLQQVVYRAGAVVRTEAGLKQGLADLEELTAKGMVAGDPVLIAENHNLLLVARAVLTAALCRDESRGPHLRFEDAAGTRPLKRRDPEWQKYIIISGDEAALKLAVRMPGS